MALALTADEDGLKSVGSPVRVAMIPVRPKPGGTGVGEQHRIGSCVVGGGGGGAVGGGRATTSGAGGYSISCWRDHYSSVGGSIAVHPW